MAKSSPALESLEKFAAQAAGGFERFGRIYLAVLFNPGREIPTVASGAGWPFPLSLILGYSLGSAVLLRATWRAILPGVGLDGTLAARQPSVLIVFLAGVVFLVALSIAALVGIRIFARQRPGLLIAMNCVAVALVPLSALTAAAWIMLYLSSVFSLLALLFGLATALCFFAEAVRSQCDLPTGSSLYVIPLMVVVALLVTGLFLFTLGAPSSQP